MGEGNRGFNGASVQLRSCGHDSTSASYQMWQHYDTKAPLLSAYERSYLQQAGWTIPCPDDYVPQDEGYEIQEHQGNAVSCSYRCDSISTCSQFAYCKHDDHIRCYLKQPFASPQTACSYRRRAYGCTWVVKAHPAPGAPTPPARPS